jgi:hypothetical protein
VQIRGREETQVAKQIWRAIDEQVREILAEEGFELTEKESQGLLDYLPLYLEVALKECVHALARQQLERRKRGDGERPGGARG